MNKLVQVVGVGLMSAVLALAGMSLSASAAHVTPTLIHGNIACDGLKIEPVSSGTYGPVTIVVSGSSFSFSTSDGFAVTDVFVKGGPNTNWYHYAGGTTSDSGLTAPINPNNNKTYGLSHLCFDVDDKKVDDPKDPPPPDDKKS